MSQKQVHITLGGTLKGATKLLNQRQFTDGVFSGIGAPEECEGLAKYYTASYNCEAWIGGLDETPPGQEDVEVEVEEDEPTPTQREQDIIAAINLVEEDWIVGVVPHPSVTKVAEILGEPTLTKVEVVAIIEKWNLIPATEEDTKE